MLTSRIILCAQGIIRDTETDSVSVFNILEAISAPKFPVVIDAIRVFSLTESEPVQAEDMELEWHVYLDDSELLSQKARIEFQGKKRHRMFIQIRGLEIPGPGELWITLNYGGELTVKTYIDVTQNSPDQKPARS